MSENSATRVLEDGQKPEQLRASELRPLLAAMTAARDGDFTKIPETGHGMVAELTAVFNQIMDRSTHFNGEVQRVKRELRSVPRRRSKRFSSGTVERTEWR